MCDRMGGLLTPELNVVYVVWMISSVPRAVEISIRFLESGVYLSDCVRIRIPDYPHMPVNRGRQIVVYQVQSKGPRKLRLYPLWPDICFTIPYSYSDIGIALR